MSDFGQRQKEIAAKVLEAEVPKDDVWRDDVLGRRELAEKLITFIDGQTQPLVISVDGSWGSGKTFFLKRLEADLKNREFETIYFNAWEDDFHNDPLVALVGQIYKHFNEPNISFCKKACIFLRTLLLGLQTYLKIELGIVLNIEDLLIKLKNSLKNFMKTEKDEVVDQYIKHNKSKKILKDNLQGLAQEYRKKNDRPLIFIIDELDRCRPTFAIELLERVKHIFDVESIVFILGMDRAQLEKSIQSVYGDIASDIYLRRFFDFEFSIPEPDLDHFFEHLIERYELKIAFDGLIRVSYSAPDQKTGMVRAQEFIPKFFSYFDISLRDLDSIMRSLILSFRNCEKNYHILPHLIIPLLIVRLKKVELYRQVTKGEISLIKGYDYLRDEIERSGLEIGEADRSFLEIIEAYFYLLCPNVREIYKQGQRIERAEGSIDSALFSKHIQKSQNQEGRIMAVIYKMREIPTGSYLNLQYVQKLINLA